MSRFPRLVFLLVACILLAVAPNGPARAEPAVRSGFVDSFDGVKIAYTFFQPEGSSPSQPAPVVFMTHGWGGTRATNPADERVATLLKAGYAVLTWDQRGFGDSGGEADVDSQEREVRDVKALMAFAAAQPGIQLDGPGDPRMGMLGGSYAGGIQLMTAAADRRVDAIVPEIAWHDLVRSLKPNGVLKLGWGTALYGAGVGTASTNGLDSSAGPQTGALAPQIHRAYAEGVATNDWTAESVEYFAARSPKRYIAGGTFPGLGTLPGIRVPTLIVQGANDTLFPIVEGLDNARLIRANGAPVKVLIFCGGHSLNPTGTTCTAGNNQHQVITAAWLAWFDNYVKDPLGDASTGASLDYQIQDGTFASAPDFPGPSPAIAATASGSIFNTAVPTSGAGLAGSPSPSAASFRVPVEVPAGATVLGSPRVALTVSGTSTPPANEVYLFLKLLNIDPAGAAVVVDDQVTPVKVTGVGQQPQMVTVDLNGASWLVRPGHKLALEVASTSGDYATSRVPWVAQVTASISLPAIGLPGPTGGAPPPPGTEVAGQRFTRDRLAASGAESNLLGLALLTSALVLLAVRRRVATTT